MRPFFPSSAPAASRPARPWLRVALFGLGLVVLWLVVSSLSPGATAPPPAVYSDDSGTVATSPSPEPPRAHRSLITPGYVLTLGLLALAGLGALYLRKRNGSPGDQGGQLRSLGRLALGQNQELCLVACGDAVLLLGVTGSNITLLKSFTVEEADTLAASPPLVESPAEPSPLRRVDLDPAPAPADRSFAHLLRHYTKEPVHPT